MSETEKAFHAAVAAAVAAAQPVNKWAIRFAVSVLVLVFGMLVMVMRQSAVTCNERTDAMKISNMRADAVRAHLIRHGDKELTPLVKHTKAPDCGLIR